MIAGAILLAAVCWALTFGLSWGNFWIKIGLSVIVICVYASHWQRPKLLLSTHSAAAGLFSAAILYGIFYLGDSFSPYILEGAAKQIGGIYALGAGTDRLPVFLLLLLITGPGEEIFWRGFLQDQLMKRLGDRNGFGMATFIYGSVHIFSMNFMLIMAAYVAGAFWGGLYLWKRDLSLVMISHALWSAFIFAVFPLH